MGQVCTCSILVNTFHTRTHTRTYARTHAHTRAHAHAHTHMHAQTCVSKYTCTLQAHIRRCARETSYFPYTGFSLLLYWHMQVNILADADMDEHWHVRVYVREHACMHACARECVCVCLCAHVRVSHAPYVCSYLYTYVLSQTVHPGGLASICVASTLSVLTLLMNCDLPSFSSLHEFWIDKD